MVPVEFISASLLVTLAVVIGKIFYNRRPASNAEQRAIYEIASKAEQFLEGVLEEINRFRLTTFRHIQDNVSVQIDSCIQRHIDSADGVINREMNSEFYSAAAKATFGLKKHRDEFENLGRGLQHKLANEEELSEDLDSIARKYSRRVEEEFSPIIHKIESFSLNLSPEVRKILNKLKKNKGRFFRLLGKDSDINQIVNLNLKQDLAIGGSIAGFGLTGMFAASALEPEKFLEFSMLSLKSLLGEGDFAALIVAEVKQWIISEFGPAAFADFAQIVFEIITIFGMVFWVWRGYRYYKIYKRVFVEKEPLENMKSNTRDKVSSSFRLCGSKLKTKLHENTDERLSEVEERVIKLKSKATRRRIWAEEKMNENGSWDWNVSGSS